MSYQDGYRDSRRDRNQFKGRSGGGRQGGHKRQRSYDDDEHGGRRTKKEFTEEELVSRMRALLVRIGEPGTKRSVRKNLDKLAQALVKKDMPTRSELMLDTLMQCVIHLTTKTPIYGTLVALLNLKDYEFGGRVISRTQQELSNAFKTRAYPKIRILVRFVGELLNSNVIAASNLVDLLEKILSTAIGEEEKLIDEDNDEELPQHTKDFLVYVVVSALPWAGKSLQDGAPSELAEILSKVESYMNSRPTPAPFHLTQLFPGSLEKTGDLLNEYWEGVKRIATFDWKVESIGMPYRHFEDLADGNQHTFILRRIPNMANGPPPNLHPVIHLFDPETEGTVKDPLERCIISQYLSDILLYFADDHKDCTKNLLELEYSSFETKHLIIETILTQMLKLPNSNHSLIYYGAIIIDLFKTMPKEIPKVLGQAINIMFHRLEELDVECRDRFAQWFAFHMSNFSFKWPWANWSFVTSLSLDSPKRVFCSSVLKSLINLSYWKRVNDILPEEFRCVLPPEAKPDFKYLSVKKDKAAQAAAAAAQAAVEAAAAKAAEKAEADGDVQMEGVEKKEKGKEASTPMHDLANGLLPLLEARASADRIQSYLDEDVTDMVASEAQIEIFIPCLLYVGSKSYSHTFNMLDRYKTVIGSLNKTADEQMRIIELVAEFWASSSTHVVVLLDKLIAYRILSPPTLVDWLFSEKNIMRFNQPLYAEVLMNLINRAIQRVTGLNKFLIKARIQSANLNPHDTFMEESGSNLASKIEDIEQKIEQTKEEKNSLIMMVLDRFCKVLQHLMERPTENGLIISTVFGRMRQILRQYSGELKENWTALEGKVFTSNLDPRILTLYRSACEM